MLSAAVGQYHSREILEKMENQFTIFWHNHRFLARYAAKWVTFNIFPVVNNQLFGRDQ
jgi:hypothetical protein